MADSDDILFEARNRSGVITLNRPKALNALTYDMIAAMEQHYVAWSSDPHIYGVVLQSSSPRAFCSGGDLKALYDWWKRGEVDTVLGLYGIEYQHNFSLDRFTKPNVALLDGLVMGGGVGICLYGTHKVATERLELAMPEVGIGFFPDVGATHALSRLPGEIGMYLALTGRAIGQADAYALDLVTHCVPAERFDAIRAAMSEAEPVDPMLDALHVPPGEGELVRLRPAIDRAFGGGSVEEILDRLESEAGEAAAWAKGTAAELRAKSPTALKVAYRLMREARTCSVADTLKLDYRLARRFINGTEFYEGIRAVIIDKDYTPQWDPPTLDAVTAEAVDAFFAPLSEGDLELVNPYEQAPGGTLQVG